jgi:hypothetical protein
VVLIIVADVLLVARPGDVPGVAPAPVQKIPIAEAP